MRFRHVLKDDFLLGKLRITTDPRKQRTSGHSHLFTSVDSVKWSESVFVFKERILTIGESVDTPRDYYAE